MTRQDFVQHAKQIAEDNYNNGGSAILHTMTAEDITTEFPTLDDVREFCGLSLVEIPDTREIDVLAQLEEWS